jgi:hypothetical protein
MIQNVTAKVADSTKGVEYVSILKYVNKINDA